MNAEEKADMLSLYMEEDKETLAEMLIDARVTCRALEQQYAALLLKHLRLLVGDPEAGIVGGADPHQSHAAFQWEKDGVPHGSRSLSNARDYEILEAALADLEVAW